MKAMIVKNYGGPEAFEFADVKTPQTEPNQVLVKISATSVNNVDLMIREMGLELPLSPQPPAILGMDFAGTVEAIGEKVDHFKIGDEVYGCAGGLLDLQGTLAQYIAADARLIAHKPKNISMREAAALPLVGITAYEGLQRAGITSGQKVLVQGGAGGVGHIALQLARHWGAEVFATVGRDTQENLVKQLGATPIKYKDESVADYVGRITDGSGFDIVYDSVGGENMPNSFEAAKLNGQVITTVAMVKTDLSTAHFKGLSMHVVFMLIPMIHNQGREKHGEILADIASIVEAGGLKPVVDEKEFSLEAVSNAHIRMSSGEAIGKIVIDV